MVKDHICKVILSTVSLLYKQYGCKYGYSDRKKKYWEKTNGQTIPRNSIKDHL